MLLTSLLLAASAVSAGPRTLAPQPETGKQGSFAVLTDPREMERFARERQQMKARYLDPGFGGSVGPSLDNHRAQDATWSNIRCDNPNIFYSSENFIEASPLNPQNVIAGSNASGWPNLSGCFYSTNGGQSFANALIPDPPAPPGYSHYLSWGDPMITWDDSGVAYYIALGY